VIPIFALLAYPLNKAIIACVFITHHIVIA
jgi:hypothetical protein